MSLVYVRSLIVPPEGADGGAMAQTVVAMVTCEGASLKLTLTPKVLARPLRDALVAPFLKALVKRAAGSVSGTVQDISAVVVDGIAVDDLSQAAGLLLRPEGAAADGAERSGFDVDVLLVLGAAAVRMLPNLDGRFLACFINLTVRTDRRDEMEKALRHAGIVAARFAARTGNEAAEADVARVWDTRLNARFDGAMAAAAAVAMTPSERGCAASHAALWRHCAALPVDGPPLLVLEDDLLMCDGLGPLLGALIELVEARHSSHGRSVLLYLSGSVPSWKEGWVETGRRTEAGEAIVLREADYIWQTSSYLVWPAAARLLLERLPCDAPADNFLSRHIHDDECALRGLVCWPLPTAQRAVHEGDICRSGFG